MTATTASLAGILGIISNSLLCLAYLVGIVAGVIVLVRKQTLKGGLAVAGFLLLGLSLVSNLVMSMAVLPAILKANGSYATFIWLNFCITSPLQLIGIVLLVILVFVSLNKKAAQTEMKEDLPPTV
jgi:hypothetical protein